MTTAQPVAGEVKKPIDKRLFEADRRKLELERRCEQLKELLLSTACPTTLQDAEAFLREHCLYSLKCNKDHDMLCVKIVISGAKYGESHSFQSKLPLSDPAVYEIRFVKKTAEVFSKWQKAWQLELANLQKQA